MENCFKSEKAFCCYENGCKNKSQSFCGECSRNLNKRIRDWFEPTKQYSDILSRIKSDETQAPEKDKIGLCDLNFKK